MEKGQQIDFLIADPAGNITILVLSETERKDYAEVAKRLLEHVPEAEQVGFVKAEGAVAMMEMCGLEFCGNASRAYAYYLVTKDDVAVGQPASKQAYSEMMIRVSGAASKLRAWADPENKISGIELPMPEAVEPIEYPLPPEEAAALNLPQILRGTLVHMEGISHLVIPVLPKASGQGKSEQESIRKIFLKLRDHVYSTCDRDMPAFGVMFLDKETLDMIPIVYVRDVDTIYFEGSCASGSSATGYALALQDLQERGKAAGTDVAKEGAGINAVKEAAGTNAAQTEADASVARPAELIRKRVVLHQPAGDLEVITESDANKVLRLMLQGSIRLSEVMHLTM